MNIERKNNRAKHMSIALPRLPLVSQIYLWGLILFGILFIVTSISTWLIIDAQTYSTIDNLTGETLDSFQTELANDVNALVLFGNWFANDGSSSIVGDNVGRANIDREIQTISNMENLDFIVVTDGHGKVLGRSDPIDANKPSSDLSGFPEIADALAGHVSLKTDVDASGQLEVKYTLPRYSNTSAVISDSSSKPIIGAVSLGFYIDENYLKSVKKNSSLDIGMVVISKDQLTASKLTSQGASLDMIQLAPGITTLDNSTFNSDHLITLMTNHGPYLYKFQPLTVLTRTDSIVIGSGVPTTILDAEHEKWLRIMGLWLLFGVIDLGVLGLFIARNLKQPLVSLSAAIQQIENGDLTHPITLRRDDEFGDLAVQLENMRRQLSERFARTEYEKNGLSSSINNLSIPVVITDGESLITMVNHAANKLLGTAQAPLIGHAWLSLFELSDDANTRVWQSASPMADETHPMIVHERRALCHDPRTVLDIRSTPIHIGAELIGYIHTLQDISEIDRFAKSKKEFLLSVAHELQGPLASWRASVDLLMEEYYNMTRAELGTMLRTLQKNVVRFQGLVEALVDMGKLEAGKFRIAPAPILFERLVMDSLAQIESVPRTHGQELKLELGIAQNIRALADRVRITQVIINLMRNASKYSPDGSTIHIKTYQTAGYLYFQVTDMGSGIPAKEQKQIFERYYRTKRVEDDGSGIGLGLALARAIIEAHGGQIGVSSELGKGSTFWFNLPEVAGTENIYE